jgi:hypothetical protein
VTRCPQRSTCRKSEAIMRVPSMEGNHMHLVRTEFTISSKPAFAHRQHTLSRPALSTRSLRWLPLLPQNRTLCRPSMIKTRASGSPLKRLETCETADHNPQVQILFVCIISLTTSHGLVSTAAYHVQKSPIRRRSSSMHHLRPPRPTQSTM